MWKPLDTPGRSSGNWIIVDQTKNCFSWEDFVGALGGLRKHWCSEMCGQLGNRWRSLVLGRESSGRSPGAWNKEEILGKTSMIWVIFSQSLQWMLGNDFVGRKRSRNGEKGHNLHPGLIRAAVLDTHRWQTQEMPRPWLFAGSLGVDVAKTERAGWPLEYWWVHSNLAFSSWWWVSMNWIFVSYLLLYLTHPTDTPHKFIL